MQHEAQIPSSDDRDDNTNPGVKMSELRRRAKAEADGGTGGPETSETKPGSADDG